MSARIIDMVRLAGSSAVTVVMIAAMAIVVASGIAAGVPLADWIMLPAVGVTVNLVAALISNTVLRSQPMLFAFHALSALFVVLLVADRLTTLRGHVEVTEGALFDPGHAVVEAGWLHRNGLADVVFVQGPFEIRYAPGMRRRETESLVRVPGEAGAWHTARVGDEHPLQIGGYRFYTSFNKGFAPVITFTGPDATPQTGAVHLPSFPLNDYRQGNEWLPPGGGKPLKLWLKFDDPIYDADNNWTFRKPRNPELVVIDDATRQTIAIGESAVLPAGTIRFDAVRSWMGYTISSSSFAPWLLAIAFVGLLCLAAHVAGRISEPQPRHGLEPDHAA